MEGTGGSEAMSVRARLRVATSAAVVLVVVLSGLLAYAAVRGASPWELLLRAALLVAASTWAWVAIRRLRRQP